MIVLLWLLSCYTVNSLELPELSEFTILPYNNELGTLPPINEISIPSEDKTSIRDLIIFIEISIVEISIIIGLYDISKTIVKNNINEVIKYCNTAVVYSLVVQLIYLIMIELLLLFYYYSIILFNWVEQDTIYDLNFKLYLPIVFPYIITYIFNKFYFNFILESQEVQYKYNYYISGKSIVFGFISIGLFTFYLHIETEYSSIDIIEYLIRYIFIIYLIICGLNKLFEK